MWARYKGEHVAPDRVNMLYGTKISVIYLILSFSLNNFNKTDLTQLKFEINWKTWNGKQIHFY